MRKGICYILFILILSSCHIKMSNMPPPPPLKTYSFAVSGFQLRDMIDSLVVKDPALFFDQYRKSKDNHVLDIFCLYETDTIVYIMAFSGDYREWLTKNDTVRVALMDIRPGKLSPDENTSVLINDTFSVNHKNLLVENFQDRIIVPLHRDIGRYARYAIRPLHEKDTLNAPWVICKGPGQTRCDTFWLTSKSGAGWVLADSNLAMPHKY